MKKTFLKNLFFAMLLVMVSLPIYAADGHDHGKEEHHDDESAEPIKGPHNGRLLNDGKFTLELAIFERGVPPEYRAWASAEGKKISPKDWQLSVELTRLGGKVDKFYFAQQEDFLRSQSEVEEPHSFDVSVTATYQNEKHHWTFPSYEGRMQLSAALATQSGVTTAIVGAGKLQKKLKMYGHILPDPDQLRQLKARFPGVVRSVKASLGKQVSAGEILATVEANESLRTYNITSPMAGMVIERHANEGEITDDKSLFTIADYRQLVLDFPVFAQDVASVQVGQKLSLKSASQEINTHITTLIPMVDGSATLTARTLLDNSKGLWITGSWVEASLTIDEISAPLLVDNRGLQTFRDWQVVFIQVGDTFEIRPLELGQSDGEFTEVLSGINAGDRYVVENSYLLKADLEKSGASHDH